MRQKVQRERSLREHQPDGVDEKGHVVVDQLNDGVRRRVAILALRRIEHAHHGAAAAPARQAQMRDGNDGKLPWLASAEVAGFDLLEVGAHVGPQSRPAQAAAQCLGPRHGGRRGRHRGDDAAVLR
jgi:hypothetical protein